MYEDSEYSRIIERLDRMMARFDRIEALLDRICSYLKSEALPQELVELERTFGRKPKL